MELVLKRKLTDFLRVEDGSIARKSIVLTGAILATSALGEATAAVATCSKCFCCHCHKVYGVHTNCV